MYLHHSSFLWSATKHNTRTTLTYNVNREWKKTALCFSQKFNQVKWKRVSYKAFEDSRHTMQTFCLIIPKPFLQATCSGLGTRGMNHDCTNMRKEETVWHLYIYVQPQCTTVRIVTHPYYREVNYKYSTVKDWNYWLTKDQGVIKMWNLLK